MSHSERYPIPQGQLALSGPVARPAPGTLPLRGDVAHIALANRYLVPHYVVPQELAVTRGPAPIRLGMDQASEQIAVLATGDRFEALDITSNWIWGSCGPDGPTGYVARTAFDV